jgi:sodium/proline symporter
LLSSLFAFALYTVAVIVIGVAATRRPQSTVEEIHLGNREHGVWTSALSTSASTESGFVLLGMAGMGYTTGVSSFWMIPAGLLGYVLNWRLLAPRLREKSGVLGAVTVPEYIALSTGSTPVSRLASSAAALFSVVFLLAYISAQFSAAGKALSSQFPVSYGIAVILAVTLIVVYAVLGGFRAVSWTDNLQAGMMLFALVILPAIILRRLGGFGAVLDALETIDPALVSPTGGTGSTKGALLVILPWLMIGIGYPGQPHGITRLMAVRDDRTLRIAPFIAMAWLCVVYGGAIVLGMAARAGYSHFPAIANDPETALTVLAVELLPGVMAGVTLAAVIAAISSTADSQLIAASSTVVRDFRTALGLEPAANELRSTRAVIVVLAVLATYFAVRRTHVVFKFVLYAFFGLGASLGPAVLYCSLAKRPRALPALLGVLTGGIVTFFVQSFTLHFLISFTAACSVIAATHATSVYTRRG